MVFGILLTKVIGANRQNALFCCMDYMKSISLAVISMLCLVFGTSTLQAQTGEKKLVQLSGLVLTSDSLIGVPYTTVIVKGTGRGTISNGQGFFSIVAEQGDVLIFTSIGFVNGTYKISDTLNQHRYSIVQLLTPDTIFLPETMVFPWPTKEQFREAFLSLNIPAGDIEIAKRNLEKQRLMELGETLAYDPSEVASLYLRSEATKFYYAGQAPPMNIFNPIAWAKFVQAWRNGDFKKK
ncbi:hypothetical protein BH09BAC1_BH09BAC1_11310 [soil metagenome]